MNHRYHRPDAVLSPYVRTVLLLDGSEPETDQLPLFTNGMQALVCRLEKDAEGNEIVQQLTLFGKSVPIDNWTISENSTVLIYFFQPFILAAIFHLPVAQLMKAPIDLASWNPQLINALRTQLLYAASTEQKTAALDHFIIGQLQQNERECAIIRFATDRLMHHSGADALSGLLDELQLNERTFQRIFKKYVGITPVQYRRICQFQLSFTQLKSGNYEKLTDVAFDNGFADQSHFIRSFREFTQTTPNDYLRSGLKEK